MFTCNCNSDWQKDDLLTADGQHSFRFARQPICPVCKLYKWKLVKNIIARHDVMSLRVNVERNDDGQTN